MSTDEMAKLLGTLHIELSAARREFAAINTALSRASKSLASLSEFAHALGNPHMPNRLIALPNGEMVDTLDLAKRQHDFLEGLPSRTEIEDLVSRRGTLLVAIAEMERQIEGITA